MKLAAEDLLRSHLVRVPKVQLQAYCSDHKVAPAKLRLVPKTDNFRPIMTFNRKAGRLTLNQRLFNAHLLMQCIKDNMTGPAVFSLNQVVNRLAEFRDQWTNLDQPLLYFVSMDIEKCYDSVDQQKLV